MKRIIYAPAAALAVIVFFIAEMLAAAAAAIITFTKDAWWLLKSLPKDFSAAYDEFLES